MLLDICFDIPFKVEYFYLEPSFVIPLRLQRFVIRLEDESRPQFAKVWWNGVVDRNDGFG